MSIQNFPIKSRIITCLLKQECILIVNEDTPAFTSIGPRVCTLGHSSVLKQATKNTFLMYHLNVRGSCLYVK